MINELKDKYVLVTGAAAGIGLGISNVLARNGARIIAVDISEKIETSFESLQSAGYFVEIERVDLSDVAQLNALFKRISERDISIFGLVNNAGITVRSNFLTASLDDFQRQFDINVRAAFLCSQFAAKSMIDSNIKGSIVNISSNHAGASVDGFESYAATKGALCSMTRAMAWSLGKYGIRVNSISPGLTSTDAINTAISEDEDLNDVYRSLHATQRINNVEDIGELVAFLMSESSKSLTGTDLLADNGMSARLFNRTYKNENN